jgi:hypothetical protein
MKTAMIIQPMAGKVYESIVSSRAKAIGVLTQLGVSIANIAAINDLGSVESMQAAGIMNPELNVLAKFLLNMSRCQIAYFCAGWEEDTICSVIHTIAVSYNFEIITE